MGTTFNEVDYVLVCLRNGRTIKLNGITSLSVSVNSTSIDYGYGITNSFYRNTHPLSVDIECDQTSLLSEGDTDGDDNVGINTSEWDEIMEGLS